MITHIEGLGHIITAVGLIAAIKTSRMVLISLRMRGFILRALIHPAPGSRYRVCPRNSLLPFWLDFNQVELPRYSAVTHRVIIPNFIPPWREFQQLDLARHDKVFTQIMNFDRCHVIITTRSNLKNWSISVYPNKPIVFRLSGIFSILHITWNLQIIKIIEDYILQL